MRRIADTPPPPRQTGIRVCLLRADGSEADAKSFTSRDWSAAAWTHAEMWLRECNGVWAGYEVRLEPIMENRK